MYRLLIADNNVALVEVVAAIFRHLGFQVLIATNPGAAREVLESQWVHLAIVDMRLTNDEESDRSGMHLVKQYAPHIPKVIWTSFAHHADAVEVMRQNSNGHQPAVDYLDKKADTDELIAKVNEILDAHVPLNRALSFASREHRYATGEDALLPLLMRIGRPSSTAIADQVGELADLFRLLFPAPTTRLAIERIFSDRGQFVLFEARAFAEQREIAQYLVVCGAPDSITGVRPGFEHYGARFGISQVRSRVTTHYAAILYSITGDLKHTVRLRDYYHTATPDHVQSFVARLYEHMLKPLCQREAVQSDPVRVAALYRERVQAHPVGTATADDLRQRIEAICRAAAGVDDAVLSAQARGLMLRSTTGEVEQLPFPTQAFQYERICEGAAPLYAVINGRLHPDTILVEPQAQSVWLCDYSRAGYGPIAFDFATLETKIKFHLLDRMSLAERMLLEQRLAAAPTLATPLPLDDCTPALQRALACIGRLRQHLAQLRSDIDLRTYQVALFYSAVRQILLHDPERSQVDNATPYLHCVVNAARLYRILTAKTPVESVMVTRFELDEAHKGVYINDYYIDLTDNDIKVLRYLSRRRGEVCLREEIIRDALGLPISRPGDLLTYKEQLDTLMSRLRQRLKPNHHLIQTIRGKGYKLNI